MVYKLSPNVVNIIINNKGVYMSVLERKSISLIRVFATILILLCHILPTFENGILQMSSQIFNVGVHIFLIISGYLYGKRKINSNTTYIKWLIKRAKRILLPLYMFLAILLSIYLMKDLEIKLFNWIINILNLQGIEIYIHGAQHLWYLTIAMICYFVTIALDINREKFTKKNSIKLLVYIAIIQVITSYYVDEQLGIYLLYILLYISSYFVGMNWNSKNVNIKYVIKFGIILFLATTIRILGRTAFDKSILYNIMIVGYTQSIIGFSLFFILFYIGTRFGEKSKFNIVKFFDDISYEIYLVHYMFIVGPVSIIGFTNSIILDNCIVVLFSIGLAMIIHNICAYILNMGNNKIRALEN